MRPGYILRSFLLHLVENPIRKWSVKEHFVDEACISTLKSIVQLRGLCFNWSMWLQWIEGFYKSEQGTNYILFLKPSKAANCFLPVKVHAPFQISTVHQESVSKKTFPTVKNATTRLLVCRRLGRALPQFFL